jgi:hypothetical protein
MKRAGVLFLFIILLSGFVLAADLGDQVKSGVDKIEGVKNGIEDTKAQIDSEGVSFWEGQLRELLLSNRYWKAVDDRFTQSNLLFLVLFARSWSLSFGMLFSFILWLFVLLSLISYSQVIFKRYWQRFLGAFALTIVLAHIQFFNFLTSTAGKIISYKDSIFWNVFTFLLILFLIIFCFVLYMSLNKVLKKSLDSQKKHESDHKLDVLVEENKTVRREISGNSNDGYDAYKDGKHVGWFKAKSEAKKAVE